jgi:hypothetical protein
MDRPDSEKIAKQKVEFIITLLRIANNDSDI